MKVHIDLSTGLMVSESAAALLQNVEVRDVTIAEFEALIEAKHQSEMTQADRFSAIEQAVDRHIDEIAAARGYGRVGLSPSAACIGYAGYANPWQVESAKFGQWMANCWSYIIQEQQKVVAGTRSMPTPAQAIAELPAMVW